MIETHAGACVRNRDRRVIDPEKEAIGALLPTCVTLAGGEVNQLKRMTVRILEIERRNAGGLSRFQYGNSWGLPFEIVRTRNSPSLA
jgi:hypothetical protein